jgi:hypothetical protein
MRGKAGEAMPDTSVDGPALELLLQVFESVGGDPARSVSMFAAGAALGWDRDAASARAQDLIGIGLLEIRTLSGAVGLAADGIDAVHAVRGTADSSAATPLGIGPGLSAAEHRRTADVCAGVRAEATAARTLTPELDADLRTLAAQLESPHPKTAIVRECLRALAAAVGPGRARTAVLSLLGE